MVNQVNLVWIRELSFRLQLIENNDQIIYTDENPTPDLFTAYDMYTEWLSSEKKNNNKLTFSKFKKNLYNIAKNDFTKYKNFHMYKCIYDES